MTDTLALEKLFDDVVALWAVESATPVSNRFGWREVTRRDVRGSRVIWVPGDENGEMGLVEAAVQLRSSAPNTARSVGTLGEMFFVDILASDSTTDANAENERKQYVAARFLFDAWWRAVYKSMPGRVAIVSTKWLTDHEVRRYGAGIRATCVIEAMIPDAPFELMNLDGASAVVDTTELDTTETDTIPEP